MLSLIRVETLRRVNNVGFLVERLTCFCDYVFSLLISVGRIGVFTKIKVNVTHLISSAGVNLGGHWRPESCLPRFKVAIIIPYRDRQAHLITLLFYLIPILKRQQVEFRVFVVEQVRIKSLLPQI